MAAPNLPAFDARVHVLEVRTLPEGPVIVSTDEALAWEARQALAQALPIRLLPDVALGAKTTGLVTVSVAPLRAQPRQAAEQVSQALMGRSVDILEKAGPDWWRVRNDDGYLGYLHREHLLPANPCWNTGYAALPKWAVRANYAQAWADPYDRTEPVFDVTAGCVLGIGDRWVDLAMSGFAVYTPDMRLGYLPSDALMPERPAEFEAAGMLPYIRQWMGAPYLWGGNTPRGIDCSGLVQLAAWLCGKTLPRDASQQVALGTPIESKNPADLLPGDLLFFGDEPHKITHVAVYEGNGCYLHASGRVRRNSLLPQAADFDAARCTTWQTSRRLS